jgi:hypothetical protein
MDEEKESRKQIITEEEAKTLPEGFEADYEKPKDASKPFDVIDHMASHTNIRKVYKFGKTVGGGYFGIVRIAELITDPQHKYAVKSIGKDNIRKEA